MKSVRFKYAFFKVCLFFAALLIFSVAVRAQDTGAKKDAATTANEDYELKIGESRKTETDYVRSTAVAVNQSNVSVGVGAEVRARQIDVLLRGVTGRVRFRASLESLRRRLEQVPQQQKSPPGNSGNR